MTPSRRRASSWAIPLPMAGSIVATATCSAPVGDTTMQRLHAERPLVAELVGAFHQGPGKSPTATGLDALREGLWVRLETSTD